MFYKLIKIIIFSISIFAISSLSFASEKLTIDPEHSYVQWSINHLGFSDQVGKWFVKGDIDFNKQDLNKSKVNINIDVTQFITGIPELNKHLQGKLFFNTNKYPLATFVSDKIESNANNKFIIFGKLTVRGITKLISFKAKLNKTGENLLNGRKTVGFSAKTTLKRSDFGIKTLLPMLSNEVNILIAVEAYLPEKEDF